MLIDHASMKATGEYSAPYTAKNVVPPLWHFRRSDSQIPAPKSSGQMVTDLKRGNLQTSLQKIAGESTTNSLSAHTVSQVPSKIATVAYPRQHDPVSSATSSTPTIPPSSTTPRSISFDCQQCEVFLEVVEKVC